MSEQPQLCKQAFANIKSGYTAPHKRLNTVETFDRAFPEIAKSVTELKQHAIWANASDKIKGVAQVKPVSTEDNPPTYAELLTGIKVVDVSNDPYYAWEPLEKKPPSAFWKYIERRRALDAIKTKFIFTEDLIEAEDEVEDQVEEEIYSDTDDTESCEDDSTQP
jgi:hypothetical protein